MKFNLKKRNFFFVLYLCVMIAILSVIVSLTFLFDETRSCVQESTRNIEFLLGAAKRPWSRGMRQNARTWPTNTLIIERNPLSDPVVLREDINDEFSTCIYASSFHHILKFFVFNCVSWLNCYRNIIKDNVNLQNFFKTTKRILTSQKKKYRDNW